MINDFFFTFSYLHFFCFIFIINDIESKSNGKKCFFIGNLEHDNGEYQSTQTVILLSVKQLLPM